MNKICKRCGKSWESRVAEPKRCPFCVSPLWNKDRVRAVGGGAKPSPVLDGREVRVEKTGPHGLEDVKRVDLSFEYLVSSEPVAVRSLLEDSAKTKPDVKRETSDRGGRKPGQRRPVFQPVKAPREGADGQVLERIDSL